MIGPRTSIAERPHRLWLYQTGAPVADGHGSFTQPLVPLDPPAVDGSLVPATGADMQRVAPGTVISHASYIATIPYHPQVTTQTVVQFKGRTFRVNGPANVEERGADMVLVCDELVS